VDDLSIREDYLGANRDPATVGVFVTCVVDLLRPAVGFAAIRLLEDAGCRVSVPRAQACCGQPAYNSGDEWTSVCIARQVIAAFERFEYVVVPSGSCAGMIREHYPRLFASDLGWLERARRLADKTFELTQFLVDVLKLEKVDSAFTGTCTYHDSCSGLRELGIREQPRQLLSMVSGVELNEMKEAETCCGFGGLFCVKYPEISTQMVSNKTDNTVRTGADTLLGGDLGCLLNIAGYLRRTDSPIRVFHVAEVLAGMAGDLGIGEQEIVT
jgi:L-lactate dehydrogenase complex protein LldE